MKTSTDIVIHINESLDSQNRVTLSDKVKKMVGVVSASLSDAKPHFMIVGYNPSETKAYDVVNNVRKTGMHAQLISWL